MPKVIENVQQRAIAQARELLIREGYTAMTVRRVAAALEIAPATLYNYFPSKGSLAASVMLEDWQRQIETFVSKQGGRSVDETVECLFALVRAFSERYAKSWTQYPADDALPIRRRYHGVLVEELAGMIRRSMTSEQDQAEPWLAPFLAELVLRMGSDGGCAWQQLAPAVHKLLG